MNKMGRNDPCWCGSGDKYKKCHAAFDERLQEFAQRGCTIPPQKIIKNERQIQGIRESGKINTQILDYVAQHIRSGLSTEEINTLVHEKTLALGGRPAPLHFEGFPKSVCTSLNDQVCHGIPAEDVLLQDGDIINVDISTEFEGYYADSSRMFCIGSVSDEARHIVATAKECVETGLQEVLPWRCLGDMGQAVYEHAVRNNCTVVREIGGHGIGLAFHEEPWVSYVSKKGTGVLMVPGMVFTIEPMINQGAPDVYTDAENGWTVYTKDGGLSAQWEVTVLVTDTGYEILSS